jgi:hypothetical protein
VAKAWMLPAILNGKNAANILFDDCLSAKNCGSNFSYLEPSVSRGAADEPAILAVWMTCEH